jgi:D-alanyl-D-alanine carboxypeptidase/D-alanyl-D-alanine-endopeptidase (penicillin-binding protein 4)
MDEVAGRVRGKTGTLGGVHTLTGYVVGADDEIYAFGYLVNNVRGSLAPVKRAQDAFLTQLATAVVPR